MAWEIRRGRRVYYRSRRVGGQGVRDYFSGEEACLAAALDEKRGRQKQADRQMIKELKIAWAMVCKPLDELLAAMDLLMRAVLLAAGYYQHHGDWRLGHANIK